MFIYLVFYISGKNLNKSGSYLNLGGSIGSFCTSTIRITRCLAPELNATPCCDGVYLHEIKHITYIDVNNQKSNTYKLDTVNFSPTVGKNRHFF